MSNASKRFTIHGRIETRGLTVHAAFDVFAVSGNDQDGGWSTLKEACEHLGFRFDEPIEGGEAESAEAALAAMTRERDELLIERSRYENALCAACALDLADEEMVLAERQPPQEEQHESRSPDGDGHGTGKPGIVEPKTHQEPSAALLRSDSTAGSEPADSQPNPEVAR